MRREALGNESVQCMFSKPRLIGKILLCTATFIFAFYFVTILTSLFRLDSALLAF
jgi:hypothetical protein